MNILSQISFHCEADHIEGFLLRNLSKATNHLILDICFSLTSNQNRMAILSKVTHELPLSMAITNVSKKRIKTTKFFELSLEPKRCAESLVKSRSLT